MTKEYTQAEKDAYKRAIYDALRLIRAMERKTVKNPKMTAKEATGVLFEQVRALGEEI